MVYVLIELAWAPHEYDDQSILGIYSSLDKALEQVREKYPEAAMAQKGSVWFWEVPNCGRLDHLGFSIQAHTVE